MVKSACDQSNKGQNNLAKGDIARSIYLLSYSPGGSTRREVVPWVHLGPIFGYRGGRLGSKVSLERERAMVVSYGLSIAIVCYL